MDSLDLLRSLSSRAQGEADPQVDVRTRVLHSLHRRPVSSAQRNLAVLSLAACSLASIAVGVVYLTAPDGDSVAYLSQAVLRSSGPEALLQLVDF